MKLVASMIVRNELGRYLEESIGHLLEFCDEVRVLDDGSTDGTFEWLAEQWTDRMGRSLCVVEVLQLASSRFFEHEGHTRQALLEWTLKGNPTHVLAIDADEFVADGRELRRRLEAEIPVRAWSLVMEEIWEAHDDVLCVREDGGWRSHPVPIVWQVPERLDASWRIADRALACGRVPVAVDRLAGHAPVIGDLLHFGWANEQERQARYDRYAIADGGRFHASAHLESIMWPCERVRLQPTTWPAGLAGRKAALLERANGVRA